MHIDIGIHFPSPPQLVVVPEVRAVRYVPTPSANLFFYGSQYWAFANGGWYTRRGYNGPWVVVAPTVVPRDVLLVPVNTTAFPGHWKQWQKQRPPHWGKSGDGRGRRSDSGRNGMMITTGAAAGVTTEATARGRGTGGTIEDARGSARQLGRILRVPIEA